MSRILCALTGAVLLIAPTTGSAFPLVPPPGQSLFTLIANGCGPGWYRGPGGACHRFGHGPYPGGYWVPIEDILGTDADPDGIVGQGAHATVTVMAPIRAATGAPIGRIGTGYPPGTKSLSCRARSFVLKWRGFGAPDKIRTPDSLVRVSVAREGPHRADPAPSLAIL